MENKTEETNPEKIDSPKTENIQPAAENENTPEIKKPVRRAPAKTAPAKQKI